MPDLTIQCPYCFEVQTLELASDDVGRMVQDCEVCCRPWDIDVYSDEEGNISADVRRAQ